MSGKPVDSGKIHTFGFRKSSFSGMEIFSSVFHVSFFKINKNRFFID